MERIRYYERTYDKDGVYKGYELYKPVISIDKGTVQEGKPIIHNVSPGMEIKPAVREHAIKHSLLVNKNLVRNPSFEEAGFIKRGKPPGWAGTSITDRKVIDVATGNIGCYVVTGSKTSVNDSEYIEATKIPLEQGENVSLVLSFEYYISRGRGWQGGAIVDIYASVNIGKYYLTSEGLWLEGVQYVIIENIETHSKLEKFELQTANIPEAGEVTIRLYGLISPDNDRTDVGNVIYDNVNLSILIDSELPKGESKLYRLIDLRHTIVPQVNEVFLSDAPELPNNKLLYRNVFYRSDGNLTTKWKRRTIDEYLSLLEILLDNFVWTDQVALHKISISLFSKWTVGSNSVSFQSIIRDPTNRGRHFIITSTTFDDKYSEWKLQATEVRTKLDPVYTDPEDPEDPEECPDRLLEDGSLRLLENGEIRLIECEEYFGDRLLEDGSQRLLEDNTVRLLEYHSVRS